MYASHKLHSRYEQYNLLLLILGVKAAVEDQKFSKSYVFFDQTASWYNAKDYCAGNE